MRVDYAKHAEAMGAHAVYTNTEADYRAALEDVKTRQGVKVIVVEVDPTKRVGSYDYGGWWDCPPAEVSEQESVRQARAEYEEARKKQVLFK